MYTTARTIQLLYTSMTNFPYLYDLPILLSKHKIHLDSGHDDNSKPIWGMSIMKAIFTHSLRSRSEVIPSITYNKYCQSLGILCACSSLPCPLLILLKDTLILSQYMTTLEVNAIENVQVFQLPKIWCDIYSSTFSCLFIFANIFPFVILLMQNHDRWQKLKYCYTVHVNVKLALYQMNWMGL